jgi:hypothetical protein
VRSACQTGTDQEQAVIHHLYPDIRTEFPLSKRDIPFFSLRY